jgi:hypothetical protein
MRVWGTAVLALVNLSSGVFLASATCVLLPLRNFSQLEFWGVSYSRSTAENAPMRHRTSLILILFFHQIDFFETPLLGGG